MDELQQSTSQHRIDPAHPSASEGTSPESLQLPGDALVAAAAGISTEHHSEQTQLQGHQLLRELTLRQREIDRREAQFNAFLATLDRQSRTERVKQSDREHELVEREKECDARLMEVAQREANIGSENELGDAPSDDANLRKLRRELEEKRIRLAAEENALRFRWQRLQTQREASMQLVRHLMRGVEQRREAVEEQASHSSPAAKSRIVPSDLDKLATELEQRQRKLSSAEAELTTARQQLATAEEQFKTQRNEWEHTRQSEQERLKQQQAIDRAQEQQQRELLQRRGEELSKRQAALDQMQASVTRIHRESLELRLATEQLWSQMGENIDPQKLAETLGQLRAKLSEHYQTASDALSKRRDELHSMASRLDEQQTRLRDDREELQQWFDRRHEEIEFQAARLVAREQELDAQVTQNAEIRERWEEQRLAYEDEIRRLRAKLRQGELAAA